MSKRQTNKLRDSDIVGLKYFDRLMPLLERLHGVGAQRDRAGNRQLFFDHYCAYLLLFLFNPIVTSLRGIQQASELKKVQKKLGCPRASLGSLSEAVEVFDPEPVKQIASELAAQLEPLGNNRSFPEVKHLVTAVDGTVVKTLARIVQAAYLRSPTDGRSLSAWRLHTHFDVERGLPVRIDVTGAGTGGENDERAVLHKTLQADRCYVLDRGYAQFSLFNAIAAMTAAPAMSAVRDNSVYEVVEQRPSSAGSSRGRRRLRRRGASGPGPASVGSARPFAAFDLHSYHAARAKRGKAGGGLGEGRAATAFWRIATNLLDVPAEVFGFIYQRRWMIEIFFRFLKHILVCRHLLSTSPAGVEIQGVCCAIIACLLIALWTGKKPTKRTYEMICFYFIGWAERGGVVGPPRKTR